MKEFIMKSILALIGSFCIFLFNKYAKTQNIVSYITFFLFLIFLYYLNEYFYALFSFIKNKTRWIFPKIGILNGNIKTVVGEYKCQNICSNITPLMWENALRMNLKKCRYRIKMITTNEINDSYYCIINPFGDNYPEEDIKLHKTFYQICKYIDNGGIFVISGGAFFHHQNVINSPTPEQAILRSVNGLQSLQDSLLYLEFGILTTGGNEPIKINTTQNEIDKSNFGILIDKNMSLNRFRAVMNKSSNYTPIIREIKDQSFPICLVKYGNGYLIHGGVYLDSETSNEFKIFIDSIKYIFEKRIIKSPKLKMWR